MSGVVSVQHLSGDVGNITSGITLSSNIDLEFRDPEFLLEILEKVGKLASDILLALGSDIADGETSANGLLNPQNISQIDPRVMVEGWLVLSPTPDESSVFLEETLERTASWATIEPDGYFIDWGSICWLENEEKCSRRVGLIDGHESRVHLANWEIHLGKRGNLEC